MDRYAIVDDTGKVINVIIWDGKSEYSPPEGCKLIPADDKTVIAAVHDYTDTGN